jgi:hypothetical protein
MKSQQEFVANGMVSIWIGNFLSDSEFDRYMNLSSDFENDFGFKVDNNGIREATVESVPMPIEKLVEGFSNWRSFGGAVTEACKKLGIQSATTMIVFYTIKFEPSKVAINPDALLRFAGSFPFL